MSEEKKAGEGLKVVIRLRMSSHDAHYGGNLVDGARMLGLFGDVATELLIRLDGDEGLFRAYDSVDFLAPVYAGDYVEAEGTITAVGRTSRKMAFEARKVIRSAPEVGEDNAGFMACEARAFRAARIAVAWGALRHDLDPGELAMAALLANAGEIELWAFVPELPQKALDELHSGRAQRSDQAQRQACGFPFLDLTLLLIENWTLPQLIKQLIRGDEGMRARMARLAVNTARHLGNGTDDAALPDDMKEAVKLTGATLDVVVGVLPDLSPEQKAVLLNTTLSTLPAAAQPAS